MTGFVAHRAVLTAPRALHFEASELEISALGPSEIFAVTEFSAISLGTEKAAYVGLPPLRPGPIYPRLVGYCNAARVVATGRGVEGLVPGDRILTHQSHRSAFICDADEVLVRIPKGVAPRTASAAYIAHIALTAFQRARFEAGEAVLVQGLGPIGLAAVALAKSLGAGRIVAIGNHPGRLALAETLGAHDTLDARAEDLDAAILRATGGHGAELVVTTVNAWSAWRTSLAAVRRFGRIGVLGFPGRGEPPPAVNPLEAEHFYGKQPSIISAGQAPGRGAWGAGDGGGVLRANMRMLVDKIAAGELPLDRLLTHDFRWSDLGDAYARAESGDKGMICPVLIWDETE